MLTAFFEFNIFSKTTWQLKQQRKMAIAKNVLQFFSRPLANLFEKHFSLKVFLKAFEFRALLSFRPTENHKNCAGVNRLDC